MSTQETKNETTENIEWKEYNLIRPLYLIGLVFVTIALASLTYFNISSEKKIAELERLALIDTLKPLVYDRFITDSIFSPIYDTVTIDTFKYVYTIKGTEYKGNWFLVRPEKNTVTSTYQGSGTLTIRDTLFLSRSEVALIDSIILNRKKHRKTKGLPQGWRTE